MELKRAVMLVELAVNDVVLQDISDGQHELAKAYKKAWETIKEHLMEIERREKA